MADNDVLEEILNGSTPATEPTGEEATGIQSEPSTEPSEGQPRGPDGKFAPKANDDHAAQAAVEGAAEPTAERPQGTVPLPALHAARQESKEQKDRADRLEREMAELRGQFQFLAQQRQQPAQPAEPAKPADFWEDPNGFVQSALSPVQEAMLRQAQNFSKVLAIQTHGRETVQAAYQAMGDALGRDPSARFEYQRIMASEHPYDELVSWHKKSQTLQRIGTDPDAYVQAEIDRLLSDPEQQAKILERIRGSATSNTRPGQTPAPVALPPSLNNLPGSNSAGGADLSSEGLFRHALGR